jgi:predicted dehydrogenase
MKKVRLGILGVSWWTNMVWPGFSQVENAEVTWIAARTGEKAEKYAEEHGIPNWTDDYAKLIAADDVDAVFVAVPNFLHEEMATKALMHGKHVLQEKPMALSSESAAAIARLASERGLILMMNHEYRLANGVQDLPGLIDTRLGALRKVIVGLTLSSGTWGGWRGDPELTGGTLFEMAIHQLDMVRWLFGKNPVAVWALGKDVSGNDMTVVLDFGDGDTGIVDVCWRSISFRMRIECYGEKGVVDQKILMPTGRGLQTLVTAAGTETVDFDASVQGAATFKRVLEGFTEAILNGAPPPVTAEDGVWAVRIAEAARQSLRTGERVAF